MSTTWVTSDHHFRHRNILRYCPWRGRYFGVPEEMLDPECKEPIPKHFVNRMDECMVEAWNFYVSKDDTVWYGGDLAFGNESFLGTFQRLNGIKHLVVGNHDEQNHKTVLSLPWASIQHYKLIKIGKASEPGAIRAVMSHYPMETWDRAPRGSLMLHGHSHGSLKRKIAHRFDVGVDAEPLREFRPFNIEELVGRAMLQPFDPVDHHAA